VAAQTTRARRSGLLPLGALGELAQAELALTLQPMLASWQELQALYPQPLDKEPLRLDLAGVRVHDWLAGLRAAGDLRVAIEMQPSNHGGQRQETSRGGAPAGHALGAHAGGQRLRRARGGRAGGARRMSVTLQPLPQPEATAQLQTLLQTWREGMPAPCRWPARPAWPGWPAPPTWRRSTKAQRSAVARCWTPAWRASSPTLKRWWPTAVLPMLAQRVLAPLRDWALNHATLQMHQDEAVDE
jgi:exonuclease V gamma subunit